MDVGNQGYVDPGPNLASSGKSSGVYTVRALRRKRGVGPLLTVYILGDRLPIWPDIARLWNIEVRPPPPCGNACRG